MGELGRAGCDVAGIRPLCIGEDGLEPIPDRLMVELEGWAE